MAMRDIYDSTPAPVAVNLPAARKALVKISDQFRAHTGSDLRVSP